MLRRGEQLKQQKKELTDIKNELQSRLLELRKYKSTCENIIKELDQRLTLNQEQINLLESQIAKQDQNIIRLRCEIEASIKNKLNEQEIVDLIQAQIIELDSKIRNIQENIESLINDYNQNKLNAENLAKQILDLQSQLARLIEELNSIKSQIEEFQQKLDATKNPAQRKQLEQKISLLKKDFGKRNAFIRGAQTKLLGFKNILGNKQKQILANVASINTQKKQKNQKQDYAARRRLQEKRRESKVKMEEEHSKQFNVLLNEATNRRSEAQRNQNQKLVEKQATQKQKSVEDKKYAAILTEQQQKIAQYNQAKENLKNVNDNLRNFLYQAERNENNINSHKY